MVHSLAELNERFSFDGVTLAVSCVVDQAGACPARPAPYAAPASLPVPDPAMDGHQVRLAAQVALAQQLQQPYQGDAQFLCVDGPAAAAMVHSIADAPLASVSQGAKLIRAPRALDTGNYTAVGDWMARAVQRRRRFAQHRPSELPERLVAMESTLKTGTGAGARALPATAGTAFDVSVASVGLYEAVITAQTPVDTLAGLYLPQRAALADPSVRQRNDMLRREFRSIVRGINRLLRKETAARGEEPARVLHSALVLDADALPDMLVRAGLPRVRASGVDGVALDRAARMHACDACVHFLALFFFPSCRGPTSSFGPQNVPSTGGQQYDTGPRCRRHLLTG